VMVPASAMIPQRHTRSPHETAFSSGTGRVRRGR
jgi:hypothetical protein